MLSCRIMTIRHIFRDIMSVNKTVFFFLDRAILQLLYNLKLGINSYQISISRRAYIYIGILISRNKMLIICIIVYFKYHKTITSRSFVLSFLEARSAQYNLCFESSCLLYPGIIVLKYDHQVHSDTRHDGKLQIYIHLSDKVLYQNKLHIH